MLPHKQLISAVLFSVLLIAPNLLDGRILYVNPQGDDINPGTDSSKPWRTPQKAADVSEPGDTIVFSGTFKVADIPVLTISRSGTKENPIRYVAAEYAVTTFESRNASEAIVLTGVSNIEIDGFRIHGGAEEVSEALAISNMSDLKDNRTVGNGIGVVADEKRGIPSHDIIVRRCVISDFPGGGLYLVHSDRVTFEENIVFRCAFWSPYANSAISIYQPVDVDSDKGGYKISILRNVCYQNHNYVPFFYSDPVPSKRTITDGNGIILDDFKGTQAFGGGKGKPYEGRTLVADNVVFENGGSGIHTYLSQNVDIVHNLAFLNNSGTRQDPNGQIYASHSSAIRVLNNLLLAPSGKPVNSDWNNGNDVDYDHNLYAATDGVPTSYSRALKSNLLGARGIGWGDWTFKGDRLVTIIESTPLRTGGVEFSEVPLDFFGTPFPKKGPRPIGPFAAGYAPIASK